MTTAAAVSSSVPDSRLPADLDRVLRATSRSIYLTLRVAPRSIRRQLMLGYLFCRAADTIADTRVLPPSRRLELLALYRGQFERDDPRVEELTSIAGMVCADPSTPGSAGAAGFSPAERELLRQLVSCFSVFSQLADGDRALLRRLLTTLTQGMEHDLSTFPSEEEARGHGLVTALETDAELDRYCYHVAGCVGEFWTDLQAAHVGAVASLDCVRMRDLGVRLGKGLQMTNVLRDVPADLRIGRCYLPRLRLESVGVDAQELRRAVETGIAAEARPDLARRVAPVFEDLLELTLDHYRAGWEYVLALPRRAVRLRLACSWPLLLGLDTLSLLRGGVEDLVAGQRLKIPRRRVYRILASSAARIGSNRALTSLYESLGGMA